MLPVPNYSKYVSPRLRLVLIISVSASMLAATIFASLNKTSLKNSLVPYQNNSWILRLISVILDFLPNFESNSSTTSTNQQQHQQPNSLVFSSFNRKKLRKRRRSSRRKSSGNNDDVNNNNTTIISATSSTSVMVVGSKKGRESDDWFTENSNDDDNYREEALKNKNNNDEQEVEEEEQEQGYEEEEEEGEEYYQEEEEEEEEEEEQEEEQTQIHRRGGRRINNNNKKQQQPNLAYLSWSEREKFLPVEEDSSLPLFIMIVGLPGSGKSTFSSKFQTNLLEKLRLAEEEEEKGEKEEEEEEEAENQTEKSKEEQQRSEKQAEAEKFSKVFHLVQSDEVRKELTGSIDEQSRNDEVWDLVASRVKSSLASGINVMLDATNVDTGYRRAFLKKLSGIPCRLRVKILQVSTSLAKQRVRSDLKEGKERSNVPDRVIEAMAKKFQESMVTLKEEPWRLVEEERDIGDIVAQLHK